MTYKIRRPVMEEYIPLSDRIEKQLDAEYDDEHKKGKLIPPSSS